MMNTNNVINIDLYKEQQGLTTSYVHSELLDFKYAVNPLVAAAGPLLMIDTQLGEQTKAPDFAALYQMLYQEVIIFEHKLRDLNYSSKMVLSAKYFVCSLIDETILSLPWGKDSLWQEKNLSQTLLREELVGERFFIILEHLMDEPDVYLELLELAYLCLSLGFVGQYRQQIRGQHTLGVLLDHLFQLIQKQKGEPQQTLALEFDEDRPSKEKPLQLLPLWAVVLVSAIILLGIFTPYYKHLKRMAAPVNQMLQKLQSSNMNTQDQ